MAGVGTVLTNSVDGSVETPPAEILSIALSPPGIPFTVQRTLLVGQPARVALNCCVRFGSTNATAGVTASGPVTLTTVNGLGEVALPSGAVNVMEPVVAPTGTEVTKRFGAASVTVA